MAEVSDSARWDARYTKRAEEPLAAPAPWLIQHIDGITPGPALDIACGLGRHGLYLAQLGFDVDAIDVSEVALDIAARSEQLEEMDKVGGSLNWHCQDLRRNTGLPRSDYQLIVLFFFIASDLLTKLPQHLAHGGWLIIEEHMHWHDPVAGPNNPNHRVAPGEIKAALAGCDIEIIECAEGLVDSADGQAYASSRLLARRV